VCEKAERHINDNGGNPLAEHSSINMGVLSQVIVRSVLGLNPFTPTKLYFESTR